MGGRIFCFASASISKFNSHHLYQYMPASRISKIRHLSCCFSVFSTPLLRKIPWVPMLKLCLVTASLYFQQNPVYLTPSSKVSISIINLQPDLRTHKSTTPYNDRIPAPTQFSKSYRWNGNEITNLIHNASLVGGYPIPLVSLFDHH